MSWWSWEAAVFVVTWTSFKSPHFDHQAPPVAHNYRISPRISPPPQLHRYTAGPGYEARGKSDKRGPRGKQNWKPNTAVSTSAGGGLCVGVGVGAESARGGGYWQWSDSIGIRSSSHIIAHHVAELPSIPQSSHSAAPSQCAGRWHWHWHWQQTDH